MASWVGSQELIYGEILTPEEVTAKIEAVTNEEVHELSKELFRSDLLSLALIGPFDGGGQKGFRLSYEPETSVNLKAELTGQGGLVIAAKASCQVPAGSAPRTSRHRG